MVSCRVSEDHSGQAALQDLQAFSTRLAIHFVGFDPKQGNKPYGKATCVILCIPQGRKALLIYVLCQNQGSTRILLGVTAR